VIAYQKNLCAGTPILELKAAIDLFLAEFSAFETHFVGMALRSLSNDSLFVKQTEALLGLEARLRLLKRMAFVRNLHPHVIAQLDAVNLRAGRLREKRDELSRNLRLIEMVGGEHARGVRGIEDEPMRWSAIAGLRTVWLPTKAEIDDWRTGTTKLQATLRAIAEQVDGRQQVDGGQHLVAGNL
jgi:hypothetical protein